MSFRILIPVLAIVAAACATDAGPSSTTAPLTTAATPDPGALVLANGFVFPPAPATPTGALDASTVADIDLVFSTLVGDQIVAFYKQYKQFGITAEDIPICTPITTEQEIQAMGA